MTALQRPLVARAQAYDFTATADAARARLLALVIDTVGCMVAGSRAQAVSRGLSGLAATAPTGRVPVFGTQIRTSAHWAALLNGTAGHADDFDDYSPAYGVHAGCVVVPAVLGAAVDRHLSGEELLSAIAVGYEAALCLGDLVTAPRRLEGPGRLGDLGDGFHVTGVVGPIAAALGVGRILHLSTRQGELAAGIATSLASGRVQNFGTATKALHAGHASFAGLLAATLAADDFTAAPDALDDLVAGSLRASCSEPLDDSLTQQVLSRLGTYVESGRALVKAHASCGLSQGAADAAVQVRNQLEGSFSEEVDDISVTLPRSALDGLPFGRPANANEAQFSVPYVVATMLIRGGLGLRQFTPDSLADPLVQGLMAKVRVQPMAEQGSSTTTVTLRRTARPSLVGEVHEPMDVLSVGGVPPTVSQKFLDNVTFAGGSMDWAQALLAQLSELPAVTDVARVAWHERP